MAVVKKNAKGGRGTYADLASLMAYVDETLHVKVRFTTVYLHDMLHQATQIQVGDQWSDPICPIPVETGDGKGLSVMQQLGSALTYARRYSLCGALGIATTDDDGQTSGYRKRSLESMTDEQQQRIDQILETMRIPPRQESAFISGILQRNVTYGTLTELQARQFIEAYDNRNRKKEVQE
ncbi:ERF family protein [Bifidobacterium olomucense]|uniref:ERF superfamily n=1 Tax=Bifidobacterium olomucense TaxID=2675324 RepID=A0A7Y0EX83_9BIFI|nr:ERF family protein [Bifidobacterium sp. DSM 109959]NMM98093.1 ERF superfamily [Bifidobacterium sp. DSM 109959]